MKNFADLTNAGIGLIGSRILLLATKIRALELGQVFAGLRAFLCLDSRISARVTSSPPVKAKIRNAAGPARFLTVFDPACRGRQCSGELCLS